MSHKNISFATFNLFNLQSPGLPWRMTSKPYTEEAYQQKISWSASMIQRIKADVFVFQELWSRQALVDIFNAASLEDEYELVFIKDQWYDIAVAAAVRQPWIVQDKIVHKNFPDDFALVKRSANNQGEDDNIEVRINQFSRSVLQLTIGHQSHPDIPEIQVFGSHLKSKLPTRLDHEEQASLSTHSQALGSALSTIRRTAEAAALRMILTQMTKNTHTPVVVCGDLNDGHLSNTVAILTGQPSYRLSQSSRKGSKSDTGLYPVSTLQQFRSLRDVYYTHIFEEAHEILDHVLVSEQFYGFSKQRVWSFREMRVWNDHVDDEDMSSSDHGVVCAYFDYDPAQ